MRAIWLGLALVEIGAAPVLADNLTFAGSILDSCTLSLGSGGTLAMSPDGTTLGSEEGSAQSARIAILSTGSHNISVGAPSLAASPGGYDPTGQQLQVSYKGQALLAAVNQGYTTTPTSFPVTTIALSTLTVNNRIVNAKGFAGGNYTMQTVVTCN